MIASILFAIWLLGFAWFLFDHGEWMARRYFRVTATDLGVSLSMALCWPIVCIAALIDLTFFEDAEEWDQ
jgi:hypothetical protein